MIHTSGLTRRFRTAREEVEAVRGLDLDITEGEVVGFLGPNGAGKTTTLRMLTTLLPATSGTAVVAGHDLRTNPVGVRRAIGYVPQGGSAGMDRAVAAELRMQGRFHGHSAQHARERATQLLQDLDLADLAERPVATLSGGQRRRLDIALGLMHAPRLLFLDEPSTGLDPRSRAQLWEHIRDLRDRHGTTVVLSTHYLDEADALCDRVLIIDHGRVAADGTPTELKDRLSGDVVVLTTATPGDAAAVVGTLPEATAVTTHEDTVSFRTRSSEAILRLLIRMLDDHGVPFTGLRSERPSLDDVFLELTGHDLKEAEHAA